VRAIAHVPRSSTESAPLAAVDPTLRVVFLSNERSPERSPSAYSHRLERLCRALEARGVQTRFVALREQPIGRPILAQPLSVPFIRTHVADTDFIHAGGNAGYTAALLKRYTRARVVQDVHGDSVAEAKLKWRDRPGLAAGYRVAQAFVADAVSFRSGDYFLAVSRPLAQKLANEHGVPPDRVTLVRNGVDLEVFRPRTAARGDDAFVVAYAGGFQGWQGIETLVTAFELLPETFRLRIVGFRPGDGELRRQLTTRLGPRADLVERVPQSRLAAELAPAHVLVIPRPRVPAVAAAFPTKFSEYLALAKPVIVCDVDESSSFVREHRCGFVSEPDPRSLADTIGAAAQTGAAGLNRMGRNARELAEREFSWEAIAGHYHRKLSEWRAAAHAPAGGSRP
jgi:glycosyltransferase involved in cell wall biosynthesis